MECLVGIETLTSLSAQQSDVAVALFVLSASLKFDLRCRCLKFP